jgi:hypothetical protein
VLENRRKNVIKEEDNRETDKGLFKFEIDFFVVVILNFFLNSLNLIEYEYAK